MFKNGLTFRGKKLTTRDIILILLALAMVILYFVFSNLNSSVTEDKTAKETEVSQARTAYNQAVQNSDVDTLTEDKAELQSQIDEVSLPDRDKGGELIILLPEWAEQSGLEITASMSSKSVTATAGTYTCNATTVSISVKGSVAQFTTFFDYIKESDIGTLVVSNINADYSSPLWSIDLQVTAYTETS